MKRRVLLAGLALLILSGCKPEPPPANARHLKIVADGHKGDVLSGIVLPAERGGGIYGSKKFDITLPGQVEMLAVPGRYEITFDFGHAPGSTYQVFVNNEEYRRGEKLIVEINKAGLEIP